MNTDSITWRDTLTYRLPDVLTSVDEARVAVAFVEAAALHGDPERSESLAVRLARRVLDAVVAGHPDASEMARVVRNALVTQGLA